MVEVEEKIRCPICGGWFPSCSFVDEQHATCLECDHDKKYHVDPIVGSVITGASCGKDGIYAIEIEKDGKKSEITIDFGYTMGNQFKDDAYFKVKEIKEEE